jgi:hypothetical protein
MGSLNHIAIFTRPDKSLAISKLSQFNNDPSTTQLNAARRILKYAVSTKDYTIKYGMTKANAIRIYGADSIRNAIRIDGYADADWGSDLTERKSTNGYIFMMNGGPISWTSKKQTTVALSTMEAEYMSLSDAARELLAHLMFFMCIGINLAPPTLFTANEAAESSDGYKHINETEAPFRFVSRRFTSFQCFNTFQIEQIDMLSHPLRAILWAQLAR